MKLIKQIWADWLPAIAFGTILCFGSYLFGYFAAQGAIKAGFTPITITVKSDDN